MKQLLSAALALGICAVTAHLATGQHAGHHKMVMPGDLKWADVPSLPPGAKIALIEGPMSEAVPFTIRLKFPANYAIPAHSHPAIERVTVLSGVFHMGTGDKLDKSKTHALPVGAMMIMQPGTNHYAWAAEETIVQLNGNGPWGITYVDPKEDPRKK
jgi:uncharacterized RmlC-like cupin family protein